MISSGNFPKALQGQPKKKPVKKRELQETRKNKTNKRGH